jgi:hypothetical protein
VWELGHSFWYYLYACVVGNPERVVQVIIVTINRFWIIQVQQCPIIITQVTVMGVVMMDQQCLITLIIIIIITRTIVLVITMMDRRCLIIPITAVMMDRQCLKILIIEHN